MSQSIARRSASQAPTTIQVPTIDPYDPKRLRAGARREAEMIAAALANMPPLDRHAMALDPSPFNEIASAEPVAAVIDKLVRRRIPGNPWLAIHGPMCKTDQSGDGYWTWVDAFRDAAFMVGVEYALRSMGRDVPAWWEDFHALDPKTKTMLEWLIKEHAAEEGGER